MEPIPIPGVPREAFNKHRLISDLVQKQVEHFKHIEDKLPADVRAKLPQHEILTENDAARYISAMTNYLLSRPRPKQVAKKAVAIKPPVSPHPRQPLAFAEATPTRKKSATKKKSAPKKETPAGKESLSTTPKARKTSPKRKK